MTFKYKNSLVSLCLALSACVHAAVPQGKHELPRSITIFAQMSAGLEIRAPRTAEDVQTNPTVTIRYEHPQIVFLIESDFSELFGKAMPSTPTKPVDVNVVIRLEYSDHIELMHGNSNVICKASVCSKPSADVADWLARWTATAL